MGSEFVDSSGSTDWMVTCNIKYFDVIWGLINLQVFNGSKVLT